MSYEIKRLSYTETYWLRDCPSGQNQIFIASRYGRPIAGLQLLPLNARLRMGRIKVLFLHRTWCAAELNGELPRGLWEAAFSWAKAERWYEFVLGFGLPVLTIPQGLPLTVLHELSFTSQKEVLPIDGEFHVLQRLSSSYFDLHQRKENRGSTAFIIEKNTAWTEWRLSHELPVLRVQLHSHCGKVLGYITLQARPPEARSPEALRILDLHAEGPESLFKLLLYAERTSRQHGGQMTIVVSERGPENHLLSQFGFVLRQPSLGRQVCAWPLLPDVDLIRLQRSKDFIQLCSLDIPPNVAAVASTGDYPVHDVRHPGQTVEEQEGLPRAPE